MIIQGLQKLTLLDYPEKLACTIFTSGCNFRCPFCHNASLVVDTHKYEKIEESEVLEFLEKRKNTLEGVCISGGEPLLQNDIEEFMKKVKDLGYKIKLDTNGSSPEKLERMIENNWVDYIAMDLKNSRQNYGKTIGIEDYSLAPIEQSIRLIMADKVPYEFRTTVVKELHKRSDFEDMAAWIKGARAYYLQQFVESSEMVASGLHPYNETIMKQALVIVKKDVKNAWLRGI